MRIRGQLFVCIEVLEYYVYCDDCPFPYIEARASY